MKKWYKSKTIWANVASILAIIAQEMGPVASALPEEWRATAMIGTVLTTALANIILRTVTNEAIG